MKILNFEVRTSDIKSGLAELADNMKILVYQENETLIDAIGFDNDMAFLEPSLFYYLRKKTLKETPKINISQILSGYSNEDVTILDVYNDESGVCYFPNMGYTILTVNELHQQMRLDIKKKTLENGKVNPLFPIDSIQNNRFSICHHKADIFDDMTIALNENIFSSKSKMLPFCNEALNIIHKICPKFYELITLTTREFVLFNSSNMESFTALHHFGTAFLNSYNTTPSVISMIEDIAHQFGHTLFYTLTHDAEKYLKVPRHTPVKNFNGRDNELRDVYGAFHGNFTFTTMFHCFDELMESNILRGEDELELKARMGFALYRYGLGIKDFEETNKLLTKEGIIYYNYFVESFEYINNKYFNEVSKFKYSNQTYSFNFDLFKQIN